MGLDERVKSQGQSLVLSKNVAVWGCRYTPIPERYCSVGLATRFEACGKSILLCRDAEGSFRAFENCCRSRHTRRSSLAW